MTEQELVSEAQPLGLDRSQWRRVSFGDVVACPNENARNPLAEGFTRCVGLDDLDPGELRIQRWGAVADGTTFTRIFRSGQVLFGKRRAYQRKAALADFDGICSGDILVFEAKPDVLLPELLPFIVQSDGFFDKALSTSAGSLSPRTKWSELSQYEFNLPPLNEQRHIAEVLLSTNELLECYKANFANLQLTLKSLVAEATATDKYLFKRIGDVGRAGRQTVQVGPFGSSLASKHFVSSGTPVLKINNITEDNELNLDNLVYVDPVYAVGFHRYSVQRGDLVTAAQATTGRTALVPDECEGALISQHLIRVSINTAICRPEFLYACFTSEIIMRQIAGVKQKSTRDGLNTADVEDFTIPLPSVDEQDLMVTRLNLLRQKTAETTRQIEKTRSVAMSLRGMLIADGEVSIVQRV